MRKILIVLALVVTAGFFACSDLPSDMNMKNVERLSGDPSLEYLTLLPYYPNGPILSSPFAPSGPIMIDKKEMLVSDYLNDCVEFRHYKNYVKCIKRKVAWLVKHGYISPELGDDIIEWAEAAEE